MKEMGFYNIIDSERITYFTKTESDMLGVSRNAVRLTAIVISLFTVAVAAAQTPETGADVVATVDGAPAVTEADVVYHLEKRDDDAVPSPVTENDVAVAVEELVGARVLVIEAEAAGYGELEFVQYEVSKFRHKALQELMLHTLESEAPVTEEELRVFYETDLKWRKYSVIECKNRAEAEAARGALAQGKPWDEVFAAYAINEDKTAAGDSGTPMLYDGRDASRAAFATHAGEYSAAVRDNDGIRWHVYRVDKIVHGRTDTFEEARPGLREYVAKVKSWGAAEKLVAESRQSVPVLRDAEMWRALTEEPFAFFAATWGLPTSVVSTAGGIPVYGYNFVFLVYDYLSLNAADLDAYRARDPDDFAYVMDRLLTKLEDEALLEYEAGRRGLDREDGFVRKCDHWRANLITDIFIAREFTDKLPALTDEDLQRYYDAHPEKFLVPEMTECYIVALADRELTRAYYERVAAGESIFDVGEAHNRRRGRELIDAYEAPPRLPPEEEDFVRALTVYREPNPKDPDVGPAADLREMVYPAPEVGTLSDFFQLPDGRWAFYEVTYYQTARKEELSDEGVKVKCRKLAWAAYLAGDDADRRAREWLATLRAKHAITISEENYGALAAAANDRRAKRD